MQQAQRRLSVVRLGMYALLRVYRKSPDKQVGFFYVKFPRGERAA